MTKKFYNQPAVQVAQFESMTLMQAASGGGGGSTQTGLPIGGGDTDIQW